MKVVIAGRPNAGKSSLLNALAGREAAIVTDIAGTTRDVLREHIHIDGMPLHIIDTAGLREATDEVERIGISRAWTEIEQADRIILMLDSSDPDSQNIEKVRSEFLSKLPNNMPVTIVRNKSRFKWRGSWTKRRKWHNDRLFIRPNTPRRRFVA